MEIKTDAKISPIPDLLRKQQEEFAKDPEKFNAKLNAKFNGKPTKTPKKFGGGGGGGGGGASKKKVAWFVNFDTVMKGDREIADRGKDSGTRIALTMNPSQAAIDPNTGKVKPNSKLKYDTIVKNNSGEASWLGVQDHPQGSDGMVSGLVTYNQGQDVSLNFNLAGLKRRHAKDINRQLKAKYEELLKNNEGNVNVPVFTAELEKLREQLINGLSLSGKQKTKADKVKKESIAINLIPKGMHSQTLMSQPYNQVDDNTRMYGTIVIPANDDSLKEIDREDKTEGSNIEVQKTLSQTQMQEFKKNFKQFESQRQAFINELVDAVTTEFSLKLGNSFKNGGGSTFDVGNKNINTTGTHNSTETQKGTNTTKNKNTNIQDIYTNSKEISGGLKKEPSDKKKSGGGPVGGFMGKLINKLGPLGKGLNFVLNLKDMFSGMGFDVGGKLTFNGGGITTTDDGTSTQTVDMTKKIDGKTTSDTKEDYFNLQTNFNFENQNNVDLTDSFKKQITQKFRSELTKEVGYEMSQYLMQRSSVTQSNRSTVGGKDETKKMGGTEYQHTVREKGKPYLKLGGRKKF
jgi:hypothetical protein